MFNPDSQEPLLNKEYHRKSIIEQIYNKSLREIELNSSTKTTIEDYVNSIKKIYIK